MKIIQQIRQDEEREAAGHLACRVTGGTLIKEPIRDEILRAVETLGDTTGTVDKSSVVDEHGHLTLLGTLAQEVLEIGDRSKKRSEERLFELLTMSDSLNF